MVGHEIFNSVLSSKQTFFEQAEELICQSANEKQWCIVSIDIEKFKLFNDWYGRKAGNKLLASISDCLDQFQSQNVGIAGHFDNDDFAFLMQYDEKKIKELYDAINAQIKLHSGKMNVLPAFGIYEIIDTNEPVYKMYDCSKLACSTIKGNYLTRIKKFEPQMLEALESELLLLTDIQNAFEKGEFTFVLQPKCNMNNGKIISAEALARWDKGENGMVSPGVFMPFLEKAGLVSELDTYIWEEVCRWQHSMLERGRETVPISVNISRMDISFIDVPMYFENLIKKYDLDPKLIELEITENVYAENTDMINQFVEKLRKIGFTVLMDDFGSAYSSLNMLKDIAIDIIKLDMRFLYGGNINEGKSAGILETVCNMAHILGLGIIAEGIENEEQKNLLVKSGCNYGQGYYFYRPLSISDFEKAIENTDVLEEKYRFADLPELLALKELINKNILSQNMLNNMLGAIAFYDVCDNQISVLRYNEQYAAIIGNPENSVVTRMNFNEYLYEEDYEKIIQVFECAKMNRHVGASADVRRRRQDGTDMWLHLRIFFLYQKDEHSIFYSSVTDVTEVHQANMVLRFLNNDMPGGYYRHKNNKDYEFAHISQRFLDIFGFTRAEIKENFDDKFINMVHPEDRETVRYSLSATGATGGNYSQPCRMRSKNGYISVLDQSRLVKFGNQEIFQGIILCNFDHYMWLNDDAKNVRENEMTTTLMPCGVFCSEADGEHQFDYISNSMLHMLGYSREAFAKKFNNRTDNMVYREDRLRITQEIASQIQKSNFVACEYRIEMADGSLKWVYSRARMTTDANGKRWFYVCITDYDYLKKKYEIQEWEYLKYKSLVEIPGMLVYDYDPESDCLTLELTMKNGRTATVMVETYVENIEKHGFLAEEHIEEQKKLLLEAATSPTSGVTEFRGRFIRELDFQWYRFHYISLVNEAGKVYRIVGRGENITEEKNKVSIWQHRATKDSLTGLLNYQSAKELINHILEEGQKGILLLLDIDNFKNVNDTLGHLEGDDLLLAVARVIQMSFRSKDVLARFGGDEFLIFMPGTFSEEIIDMKMQEFLGKISQVSLSEGLPIHCSIGVTVADGSTIPFDTLFRQADKALYESKRSGKNKYTFLPIVQMSE